MANDYKNTLIRNLALPRAREWQSCVVFPKLSLGVKTTLQNCPNHDISRHIQVHSFYHSLTNGDKDKHDHLNGNSFLSEIIGKCHNLLNNLVANHYEKKSEWATPSKAIGVIEVDQVTTLNAEINFLVQSMRKFGANQVQHTLAICEECGEGHPSDQCRHSVKSIQFVKTLMQFIASTFANFKTMETQIGQLANAINFLPQGLLPSNIEPNPRQDGEAQCEVVTLHNENKVEASLEVSQFTTLQPPFPRRLQKQKLEKQFQKFLEIFKKLYIDISFAKALEQMPSYIKFKKDILSKKRRLVDYEMVALTEECSAIIQNKIPPKLKDPGSFTISCTIDTHFSGRVLCDLGASINLMPYSIYCILGLREAKPANITLQLADRSLTYPKRVIENILVKVDKFIFPADLVVLDMKADNETLIILGRPFLATGRTLINIQNGEFTMRDQEQHITFNVFKAMKFPNESDECFSISALDSFARKEPITEQPLDQLEHALLDLADDENEEDLEAVNTLDASKFFKSKGVESLERTAPSKVLEPSIEEPPTLELKPFPNHPRYAYLGESNTLPVIISYSLSYVQAEKLLRELRNHKSAIEWTIANIKGISPSFCMYKILLEDDQKPSVKSQRRLNPIMKEVRCMMAIFTYMEENFLEVFMNDISVYENSFDECRNNLSLILKRYFSKISKPIYNLLEKDIPFKFKDACLLAFNELKGRLISTPIITIPNWAVPFELMYDANDFAIGAVLAQQNKKFLFDTQRYFWDEPFLFKQCYNNILRHCVPEVEINDILEQCHASPSSGHFQGDRTAAKIL
ncbi:DNA-directed DNA polymerase [Handroanthus impetiginosus]|uniref:DNA-directed DNA polymerase n=1 Tax=Handroanthus impetiginosus TaxID=429701 RepID=A0A2G9GW01_9LAMI|nr:DNA-directed DNA polymerase [Handroanthus impetiginosus]